MSRVWGLTVLSPTLRASRPTRGARTFPSSLVSNVCFTFNRESLKRNVVALVAVVAPWPAHASVLSGWVAQRERDVQLSVAVVA